MINLGIFAPILTANIEVFSPKIETEFLFQNGQLAKRPTSSTANFEVYLYLFSGGAYFHLKVF